MIIRYFEIENAKRIRHCETLAVGIHLSHHWRQRLAQSLVILGPIVRTADGIKLEGPIRNAQTVKQRRQQFQQFGVARGRLATRGRRSNNLSVDLIELSVTYLL